jgi:hypothetical protein
MKIGFSFLFVMSFLVLSGGCNPNYWGIPHIPSKVYTKHRTQTRKVRVWIMEGGKAPMKVKNLKAECVDKTICSTEIDNDHMHESFIVIKKLKGGTTKVRVEYFHPVRKRIFKHTITVL